jgi:lysozyme
VHLSQAGLDAIKRHEGLRLEAYPDPGSRDGLPITVGYGSTRKLDGSRWKIGDKITEREAEEVLRRDLGHAEATVLRLVKVPLSQPQFDALVSLCYNIGAGEFAHSTLLRLLNDGNYAGAAEQFARWRLNDGTIMEGLVKRRAFEAALFRSGIVTSPGREAPAIKPVVPAELAKPAAPPVPPAPAQVPLGEPIVLPGEQPPAPIVESIPVYVKDEEVNPFVKVAMPELTRQIPELTNTFGDGEVTKNNESAAARVVQIVKSATGAPNAQAAVEAVAKDPQARTAATEALRDQNWFEATEAKGGGLKDARQFNLDASSKDVWRMPAMWVTILLMPLAYMVVGAVLFMDSFSGEMKALVIGGIMSGVLAAVVAFWLGTLNRASS